jgi:hypothetical protein
MARRRTVRRFLARALALCGIGILTLPVAALPVAALAAPAPAGCPVPEPYPSAASVAALASAAQAPAAPARGVLPITLTADHIEYNTQTGIVDATGHVRVTRGDVVVTANHVTGNLRSGEIQATGAVTLTRAGHTIRAQSARYNFRTRAGEMEHVSTAYGVWTLNSGSLQEQPSGRSVATETSLTPCSARRPAFLIRAQRIVLVPEQSITAYNSSIYIYGVRVLTLPTYTVSLRPGRRAYSGPDVGYDNQNGAWIEYNYYSMLDTPFGPADNRLRVRLATQTLLTAEDLLSERMADHLVDLHVGRVDTFDQNGNLFTLDQYAADIAYDTHQLLNLPLYYSLEAHGGTYHEIQTGVSTTRAEALVNFATPTMRLSPTLSWAASGEAREDVYGTGQQRTILASTIGVIDVVNTSSLASLTYNVASINGATPFAFDAISPDNTVALGYSISTAGPVQVAGASVSYSFLTQQPTLGLNASFAVTPQVLFSVSSQYNLSVQQWTEVDYAINARCDCVSIGLLYRTFPTNPAANQILFTVGLSAFPQALSSMRF